MHFGEGVRGAGDPKGEDEKHGGHPDRRARLRRRGVHDLGERRNELAESPDVSSCTSAKACAEPAIRRGRMKSMGGIRIAVRGYGDEVSTTWVSVAMNWRRARTCPHALR